MNREQIKGARYVLWLNYGSEGWQPKPFEDERQLNEFLHGGGGTNEFVITKGPLELRTIS